MVYRQGMRWTQAYVNMVQGWTKQLDVRMADSTLAAQVFELGGIYRVLASSAITHLHLFADATSLDEAVMWAEDWAESVI